MKTTLQLFVILFCAILFTGCSKKDVVVSAEDQLATLLTGGSNRVWRLNKVFVKNVQQALTTDQMKYTKTFTLNPAQKLLGGYTDFDGNFGEWIITSSKIFRLVFTTAGGGQYDIEYIIREISETTLDIQYTKNGETIREVYYAF